MRITSLALSLLLLAGCGEKVSGVWQSEGGESRIELYDSGDVALVEGPVKVTGAWEEIEAGKLKIELSGIASIVGAQICDVAFDDKAMVLSGCALEGRYARVDG